MSDAWCDLCKEQLVDLYDVWDGKHTLRLCEWCKEAVEQMLEPEFWDEFVEED